MRRAVTRNARHGGFAANQSDVISSKLRAFGVALLCCKVVVVPLVFDASLDLPFTVPKVLVSHALAYALAGVMVGLLIQFGRSFFVWSWLHVPVLAFLAVNVAATLVAVNSTLALYGTHARMLGLGTVADWVLLYFAVALLVRRRVEATAVVACGLGASVLVIAYELVQVAGKDPLSWSFDPAVRPFSTIGQPNSLAQYLSILALGSAAIGLFVPGLRRLVRTALLVYSVVLLAGAAATGTRSILIGLATGIALLLVLLWLVNPSRQARLISALGAGLVLGALTAVMVFSPLGARLAATITPNTDGSSDGLVEQLDPASDTRVALYAIAAGVVSERPLLGYGPDNFAAGVPKYRPERAPDEVREGAATSAHSWVAYVATSSGLLGLGSFIAIAAVALSLVLRSDDRPSAAASAVMIAAFLGTGLTTIDDIVVDSLFWLSAGAVAAATTRGARSIAPPPMPSHTRRGTRRLGRYAQLRSVLALVCAATGVLLIPTIADAWDASRSVRLSADSRLQGRVPQALEHGARATRLDPGRAEYWHRLGLAYAAGARFREAGSSFERALQLAPYDVRYLGDLVVSQLLLADAGDSGSRSRALDLAERGVRTDANNPDAHLIRAAARQFVKDLPEALRSVERALSLSPGSRKERLYVTAAQIYIDSGRPADAVRVTREGLAILGTTVRTVPIRYELARALSASGQPSEALSELEIVLTLQPNHAEAQRLQAAIRAQPGK
jgi:O-antigen ligase